MLTGWTFLGLGVGWVACYLYDWVKRQTLPKPGDWIEDLRPLYDSDGNRVYPFPFHKVEHVYRDGSVIVEKDSVVLFQVPIEKSDYKLVKPSPRRRPGRQSVSRSGCWY
jgi:hypothetical protein